jgi:DNA-3-methyladenine glycosylase
MPPTRLDHSFYLQDVLVVAPDLLGKSLVRSWPDGKVSRHIITETEAYRGFEDKACHASKGKTARTEVMFKTGGHLYMYLIYGMHWMLNIVTADADVPQAVLIRSINDFQGPGRLTRGLALDRTFNGMDLIDSHEIWIEDTGATCALKSGPRVGIDYAGDFWKNRPWRFWTDDFQLGR